MTLPWRGAKFRQFLVLKFARLSFEKECGWPKICMASLVVRNARADITEYGRNTMKQDNGTFGLIVGGLVALAAVFFIFGGGDFGGKKTVDGDQDLPPIAAAD